MKWIFGVVVVCVMLFVSVSANITDQADNLLVEQEVGTQYTMPNPYKIISDALGDVIMIMKNFFYGVKNG